MSANIKWRPLKQGKDIGVNAPSSFQEAFREAFHELPCILHESDLERLIGFRAGFSNEKEAIDALISALETHEDIEVFAVY